MTEKVFEGIINDRKFDNYEEFSKALAETKPEEIENYSCSYKEKTVETDCKEVEKQKELDLNFGVTDLLESIVKEYARLFGSDEAKKLTEHVKEEQKEEQPLTKPIDVEHFVKNFDMDTLEGEDYYAIEQLEKELSSLKDEFATLDWGDRKKVTTKFPDYIKQLEDKISRSSEKQNNLYADLKHCRKTVDELEDKIAILESGQIILDDLKDYYTDLLELK